MSIDPRPRYTPLRPLMALGTQRSRSSAYRTSTQMVVDGPAGRGIQSSSSQLTRPKSSHATLGVAPHSAGMLDTQQLHCASAAGAASASSSGPRLAHRTTFRHNQPPGGDTHPRGGSARSCRANSFAMAAKFSQISDV
eukprot:6475211-Prymnesium_polylepis.1